MVKPATAADGRWDADPLLGLVAGCYVAAAVAPPVVFAGDAGLSLAAGGLYGLLLGTVLAVTAVVWVAVARARSLVVRLGRSRARWLLAVAPVGYALGGFALLGQTGIAGVLAFFAGLGAALLGIALAAMAHTRYVAATVDEASVEWDGRTGWPERARRRWRRGAWVVIGVTAVGFAVGVLTDRWWLRVAAQALFAGGVGFAQTGQERRYVCTEAGVEQRLPVARRLFGWATFDGYTRTDEAFVLHRPWRTDLRFAVADIDDPEVLADVLRRHLD
ncbi:hypothetical protein [Haloarcula litorea]|uniref:hypothetical protein n=1 Tax=Haloarcula litorea TaxID=3032579 RepID=UPI0023E7AFCF|nr:hypothetical protein [Halomicroarcula sp. GDY20]